MEHGVAVSEKEEELVLGHWMGLSTQVEEWHFGFAGDLEVRDPMENVQRREMKAFSASSAQT